MTPVVTLFEATLQEELNAITGRGRHVVYGQAHLRPVLAFLWVVLSNGTAYSTYFEQPRPRGGHWKMWKQLTRLSLVWKTVGGVAKPFFNETQGKPCGGRRPSGLGQPTGKSAGPGQDPLQDGRPHPEPSGGGVRHHLGLLQQSPHTIEAEDVIGWTGVQPRREGAWRKPKPPGWRKKKTSFLFCTGSIVW
jgi:hypothetical protein